MASIQRDKVVSFSIFGDNLKYINGLLHNYEAMKQHFPGWQMAVFYDSTCPKWLPELFGDLKLARTFDMTNLPLNKMMWRFFVSSFWVLDLERFIVRDADSRLSERDALVVEAWEKSRKRLHIIRDHPSHTSLIMGGLWGFVQEDIDAHLFFQNGLRFCAENPIHMTSYSADQLFLERIYHTFRNDLLVHAAFNKYEQEAEDFPSKRKNYEFLGEVCDMEGNPVGVREAIGLFESTGTGNST
jgi:hypothetical protein